MIQISDILMFLEQDGIPYTFSGNAAVEINRFSSISRYKPGSFTWIKTQKNIPDDFNLSDLTLVFTEDVVDVGTAPNVIRTAQSKRAFFSAIEHFYGECEDRPAIGQFTYISPKVRLGKNVHIGHNCTLDGDIEIGDNTVIWNNVTIINRVTIGENCDIHSGAVIGHDGFGYTEEDHKKTMVKHFGGVSIGNHVLICENVCISRGTIDDTVLEDGVKVDSLSHIAHNCYHHKNVALAAPCRTNGSVEIGENAYLAGAIVRNQCFIGKNAFVGLGAVVVKDVEAEQIVVGNPARPFTKKKQ